MVIGSSSLLSVHLSCYPSCQLVTLTVPVFPLLLLSPDKPLYIQLSSRPLPTSCLSRKCVEKKMSAKLNPVNVARLLLKHYSAFQQVFFYFLCIDSGPL